MYAIFLLGLSVGGLAVLADKLGDRVATQGRATVAPWWVALGAPVVVLLVGILGALAMHLVLQVLEYVTFAWRKCPGCGARRWSWGFTRGFGL